MLCCSSDVSSEKHAEEKKKTQMSLPKSTQKRKGICSKCSPCNWMDTIATFHAPRQARHGTPTYQLQEEVNQVTKRKSSFEPGHRNEV